MKDPIARPSVLSVLVILATFSVTAPAGAIVVVNPDGSGDYPTIQAAVDAAAASDVIQLGPGVFTGPGNRDILVTGKVLTIRGGGDDPTLCVIDAGGAMETPHRIFRVVGAATMTTIYGLTLTGGWLEAPDGGSAVLCEDGAPVSLVHCAIRGNHGSAVKSDGASLSVSHCSFRQNEASWGGALNCEYGDGSICDSEFVENAATLGGACYAFHGNLVFQDCTFHANRADQAPALGLFEFTHAQIRRCTFTENEQLEYYGVVTFFLACQGVVEGCTFAANDCPQGSAIYSEKISTTRIEGCTLWGNVAGQGAVWAGHMQVELANTLIAATTVGPAVESPYNHATLTCCDLFANAGGDWTDPIADQLGQNGNISADPLLCDPEAGDFHLATSSPCAPFTQPNPECDLIGAWGVECEAVATVSTTWSDVKALFGR